MDAVTPPAVEISGLVVRYGAKTAVDGASFTVPRGSIFGLIGPNGAGKTSCLSVITTLVEPAAGEVRVCGLDAAAQPREVKQRIGYAPEELALYSGLGARDFVELSATLHGVPAAEGTRRADSLLARFGLAERAEDAVGSLSKGMKRKTLIAAALVHEPELLVLDEPMEGLDVIAQRTLKEVLRERTAAGAAVLYSSHILEVVAGLCTHLAIIDGGRIRASGPIDAVRRELGVEDLADAFPGPSSAAAGTGP
ncbi:MAG TPA: ABC transporter ATP-binding protein [Thermoanaerobaculia bacterium]|nr:ABC transporter ATP-binding protein [Thermoanaerobaculia bacterium]